MINTHKQIQLTGCKINTGHIFVASNPFLSGYLSFDESEVF